MLPPPGGPPLNPPLVLDDELPVVVGVTPADELPELADTLPVLPMTHYLS